MEEFSDKRKLWFCVNMWVYNQVVVLEEYFLRTEKWRDTMDITDKQYTFKRVSLRFIFPLEPVASYSLLRARNLDETENDILQFYLRNEIKKKKQKVILHSNCWCCSEKIKQQHLEMKKLFHSTKKIFSKEREKKNIKKIKKECNTDRDVKTPSQHLVEECELSQL